MWLYILTVVEFKLMIYYLKPFVIRSILSLRVLAKQFCPTLSLRASAKQSRSW